MGEKPQWGGKHKVQRGSWSSCQGGRVGDRGLEPRLNEGEAEMGAKGSEVS